MNATANSNIIIAKKIPNGIIVRIATNKEAPNNLYRKVANIFNKVWPAKRLLKSRRPSDPARAT